MPNVLYCDDEIKFITGFENSHKGTDFSVQAYSGDPRSLPRYLANLRKLPDLLVMDLYHTKSKPGSPEAEESNRAVEDKLVEISQKVEELRVIVDKDKEPRALDVLEDLRKSHDKRVKDIPVLIYTRQGLSLLGNKELTRAIELKAEWMVKGRGGEFERARMYRYLEQATMHRRIARDVIIGLVFLLSGFFLDRIWDWLFR